jgi:hypothetical protein
VNGGDDALNSSASAAFHNETNSPEAEAFETIVMDEEDDDENTFWSGFISVLSKGRCGMDAKLLHSNG